MSKKVVWNDPKLTSAKRAGTYGSYQEFLQKANKMRAAQEEAQAYLAKATPAMLKLLEIRFTNGEPLTVMRPFQYQTSGFAKDQMDDLDKSFYNTAKQRPQMDRIVDQIVTVNPGTKLLLKSLDVPMREFIFHDENGNEHAISFDDKNKLMTQTDVFETVKKLFEIKEQDNG